MSDFGGVKRAFRLIDPNTGPKLIASFILSFVSNLPLTFLPEQLKTQSVYIAITDWLNSNLIYNQNRRFFIDPLRNQSMVYRFIVNKKTHIYSL